MEYATGRFLSVLAGSMLHFSAKQLSIKVLPVELPVNSRPIELITLKNRTLSPVVHLFIGCAREVAKPIGKNFKLSDVSPKFQTNTAKPRSLSSSTPRSQNKKR